VSSDNELRYALSRSLHDSGYRTFEAPGVLEAHAFLARTLDLGLVVIDVGFGEGTWEIIRSIEQSGRLTPVLVLSQSATDEEQSRSSVMIQYIRRPFEIAQFLERVGFVIARMQRA